MTDEKLTPEEIRKIVARLVEEKQQGYTTVAVTMGAKAQLAKSQEVCPECKGRRKIDAISNDGFGYTKDIIARCPICQGTGKKLRKDRPELREKIVWEVLYPMVTKDHARVDIETLIYEYADKLHALMPDVEAIRKQAADTIKGIVKMYEEDEANTVEEAKREERMRIIEYLKEHYGDVGTNASRATAYRIAKDLALALTLCEIDGQALRGEGES